MNYVLCSGGLGNQMFQYAFYKVIQDKGIDVVFDTSFFKHKDIHNGYELEKCFGIKDGRDKPDHFSFFYKCVYHLMYKFHLNRFFSVQVETSEYKIQPERIKNSGVLYGFWQGAEYFREAHQLIKETFVFNNLSSETLQLVQCINAENSVAIHVRRGDYVNSLTYLDLTSTTYYENALKVAESHSSKKNSYYIFSDDPEWCLKSGMFPSNATYVSFNRGKRAYEDMYLMSQCKTIILANSSFSWWAGYLSDESYIIRPSRYTRKWTAADDNRLYPKEWTKIEV